MKVLELILWSRMCMFSSFSHGLPLGTTASFESPNTCTFNYLGLTGMHKYFSVRGSPGWSGDLPGMCPTSHPVLAGTGSNPSRSIYDIGSNDMIINEWMELQLASWIFCLFIQLSYQKKTPRVEICAQRLKGSSVTVPEYTIRHGSSV